MAIVPIVDLTTHQPHRHDEVACWLKTKRDEFHSHVLGWSILDGLLDEYRLRADYGKSLSDDIEDCE